MSLRGLLLIVFFSLQPLLAQSSWTLTWRDEFDGPALDTTKWSYATGANGWGNNELEYYTSRPDNVYLENRMLVLKALKESYAGAPFTSGRIHTSGKFSQAYGRIEARIRIPYGQGIWPAFWMMGVDSETAGWPGCGEIDIMENIGKEPFNVYGTVHGPGYSGAQGIGSAYRLPGEKPLSDAFHVYAIEWEPDQIRWYIDDHLYRTTKKTDLPTGSRWAFDHPFYILLNLAVGGNWPGYPDSTTVFPQYMRVDYVRVYSAPSAPRGRR